MNKLNKKLKENNAQNWFVGGLGFGIGIMMFMSTSLLNIYGWGAVIVGIINLLVAYYG